MATSALPKDLSKLEVKTGNIKHNYQNQRVSSSVDTSDVAVIAYSNKPVAGGAEGQKQKDFIPGDGDGFSEVKQKKNKRSNKKPGSSSPSSSPVAAANHQQQQPQQAVAPVDNQKKGDNAAAAVATATPSTKVEQPPATKKPQNQKANGGANTGTATKSAPATGAPAVSNQKKALAKKLRQIEKLKKLKAEGKTLSEEEVTKVATEQDLQSQLKKLK